jgi:hypothetical protein
MIMERRERKWQIDRGKGEAGRRRSLKEGNTGQKKKKLWIVNLDNKRATIFIKRSRSNSQIDGRKRQRH